MITKFHCNALLKTCMPLFRWFVFVQWTLNMFRIIETLVLELCKPHNHSTLSECHINENRIIKMNILRKLTQLIPVRVTATPHGLMNCPLPRPLFPICLITAVFFVSMFECDSEFKRWPREDWKHWHQHVYPSSDFIVSTGALWKK